MKRVKMIWFAVGAASALPVVLIVAWMTQTTTIRDESVSYLQFRNAPGQQSDSSERRVAASEPFEALRRCGAKKIEFYSDEPNGSPSPTFPLVRENMDSLECVLAVAREKNLEISVATRWASPEETN